VRRGGTHYRKPIRNHCREPKWALIFSTSRQPRVVWDCSSMRQDGSSPRARAVGGASSLKRRAYFRAYDSYSALCSHWGLTIPTSAMAEEQSFIRVSSTGNSWPTGAIRPQPRNTHKTVFKIPRAAICVRSIRVQSIERSSACICGSMAFA
jgi:hypothetical protein